MMTFDTIRIPATLDERIAATGIDGRWFTPDSLKNVPNAPGAYALCIRLRRPAAVAFSNICHRIQPGWYVYLGSARGPGGLRARLKRHFKSEKKPHWHVDHLTVIATESMALAVENGYECDLVAHLLHHGGFAAAITNFGNSDCSNCVSHLLAPV